MYLYKQILFLRKAGILTKVGIKVKGKGYNKPKPKLIKVSLIKGI